MSYRTIAKPYSSMLHNLKLVSVYEANLKKISTEDVPTNSSVITGSSDMGNVAHVIPCIHPEFYIGGTEIYHTRGFTADSGRHILDECVRTCARVCVCIHACACVFLTLCESETTKWVL